MGTGSTTLLILVPSAILDTVDHSILDHLLGLELGGGLQLFQSNLESKFQCVVQGGGGLLLNLSASGL